MPISRFALHGLSPPPLIHTVCALWFTHLIQAPLDTCLDSPFSASLSFRFAAFGMF